MVALVVEAAPEQFPGGGYAVMGLEALVIQESVHDVGVESYDSSAAVGQFSGVLGEFLPCLFHLGVVRLTSRPGSASESDSVVGADVVFEFGESDFDEFSGGIHAVVWLKALMVEFAIGDLHEEADDGSSAVCFFCDNLG